MAVADIAFYAKQADAMSRHGLRTQDYSAGKENRAYVTLKRYKTRLFWATNVAGRPCYMGQKAYEIYIATGKELRAGRELHTSTLANLTGASQGYVTKVLQFLHRFQFIVVTAVKRGRYGGILAHLATAIRQSFLPSRRVSLYGGMINRGHYAQDYETYVASLADGDLYVPTGIRWAT